jgi:hypothetical protein
MSDFPTPNDNSEQVAGSEKPAAQDSHLNKRRDLLKAGMAVAPIILTIKSQAALGCGGTCFTPSRSLSKNTSLKQKQSEGVCNGISPGNYKSQLDPTKPSYNWPVSPNTLFSSVFIDPHHKYGTTVNGHFKSYTLLQVLNLNGTNDPSKIAFHVVGAYLNILNHLIPSQVLTVNSLQKIWSDYANNGYYYVSGVKWYAGDIVAYLQNSNISP